MKYKIKSVLVEVKVVGVLPDTPKKHFIARYNGRTFICPNWRVHRCGETSVTIKAKQLSFPLDHYLILPLSGGVFYNGGI